MPKLWTETVEAHRQSVQAAILEAASSLVDEHGLRGVTMSQIAERTGIGRATLYKYFPDVESMLEAWHAQQVEAHLAQLEELRERVRPDADGLKQVLSTYAVLRYGGALHASAGARGTLVRRLHAGDQMDAARSRLFEFMRGLLSEAAKTGAARGDLPPGELAAYCLNALEAARDLGSKAAIRRLVDVTLDGIQGTSGSA